MMKILGISGSPRGRGNTGILVEKVLEGARKEGVETEMIGLGDLQINPCRACESCRSTGECIQNDDMKVIYSSVEEMHALVLGTPIYYDHVSAQTKIFIDRLYRYGAKRLYTTPTEPVVSRKQLPKNVKAVVIITYEWNNPDAYDPVIEWIKGRLQNYWKIDVVDTIKASNTVLRPVSGRKDLLGEAVKAGERLSTILFAQQ